MDVRIGFSVIMMNHHDTPPNLRVLVSQIGGETDDVVEEEGVAGVLGGRGRGRRRGVGAARRRRDPFLHPSLTSAASTWQTAGGDNV